MRRIVIMLLSVVALAATPELAAARDGCGPGRYWNGYRCASMYGYGPSYYGYGRYGGTTGYGYGYRRPGTATQVDPWGTTCYRGVCCPRGYSNQDGVCKPYRGY